MTTQEPVNHPANARESGKAVETPNISIQIETKQHLLTDRYRVQQLLEITESLVECIKSVDDYEFVEPKLITMVELQYRGNKRPCLEA